MIWAYSLCIAVSVGLKKLVMDYKTYRSILGLLRLTTLECDPVPLVLETLGCDQTLDPRRFGVRLCALLLGLDLATNDKLANLQTDRTSLAY